MPLKLIHHGFYADDLACKITGHGWKGKGAAISREMAAASSRLTLDADRALGKSARNEILSRSGYRCGTFVI
jgi:hypothetical protein